MAAFAYLASFDVEDIRNGFGSVTFSRSGVGSFVISLPADVVGATADITGNTGVYNHYNLGLAASDAEDSTESDALAHTVAFLALREKMTALMVSKGASAGWSSSGTLACTFNTTTLRYTFSYGGGQNFTAITFSNAATRALFGFSANFSGSSGSVSGTLLPDFAIQPILSMITTEGDEGVNYEPGGLSMTSQTVWGSQFGLTRTVPPVYRDWTQQGETKAKAIRARVGFGVIADFTHQALFEKCRSVHPFVVMNMYGDGVDYVFKLRPDTCAWSTRVCKRNGGETDDALFNVSYQAQVLGKF